MRHFLEPFIQCLSKYILQIVISKMLPSFIQKWYKLSKRRYEPYLTSKTQLSDRNNFCIWFVFSFIHAHLSFSYLLCLLFCSVNSDQTMPFGHRVKEKLKTILTTHSGSGRYVPFSKYLFGHSAHGSSAWKL